MSSTLTQPSSALPKVLVVEDEPGLRFIISDVLTNDHGLTVVEAESGDQALHVLGEDSGIGCVFTDVRMPGAADGTTLTQRVQREHPDIKVLVTSGHLTPPAGIEDIPFVAKPYNLEQVAAKIAELMRALGPR